MLFLILAAFFFITWVGMTLASYTLGGIGHLLLVLAAVFVIVHFAGGRHRHI